MDKAEHNYRLLQEIEENRRFLLQVYVQNPGLLKTADARIRPLLAPLAIEKTQPPITQRGFSLIELIMFIVIVGVAVAGILLVMNMTTRGSADPLVHKQALAIAESLLEEVELMPFTFCDTNDVNAASAVAAADCTGGAGGANDESNLPLGLEAGETRYHASTPFDNVSDYNGFGMAAGALLDITGIPVEPAGYAVAVVVAASGIPAAGATPAIPAAEALGITVTVTGPDNVPIVVEGYRTRYAPRAVP